MRAVFAIVLLLMQVPVASAQAQSPKPTWAETKCIRYKAAWEELKAIRGLKGLGPEFLQRHQAFIDAGCRNSTHVCPRSDDELEVTDMMVIAAMNGGMASTFPPFSCKR